MTESKLKAKEMVDMLGLDKAKEQCKELIDISYKCISFLDSEAYSHAFQYWGDVMDELNEMEL